MKTSYPHIGDLSDSEAVEASYNLRRNPQTTAWIVLTIAFCTFWILLFGAFVGAKHYYDSAAVAQSGTLTREQGIVLFRDAISSNLMNAQDNLSLREGDELLVGQGARASLLLFDGSSMRIYSGTELRISELCKSRFHNDFSRIGIKLVQGTVRFEVGNPVTNGRQFQVTTPHGVVSLSKGSFGFLVSDTTSRISSREGTASAQANGKVVEFGAGEKVVITPTQMSDPLPEGDQLIVNGDFSQGFAQWQTLDIDEPGREPEPGKRMLVTDRINNHEALALRIERVSQKATHNETGLSQSIDKDVSDYQALLLDAYVRVDDQSLSGGGYMGYEYPMMIRVKYRDAQGNQIDWSHGFYAKNPEERPTPNGESVPQGRWIHYNGDLMEIKPRPVHIISVDILGAGHSFASSIANFSLIGK